MTEVLRSWKSNSRTGLNFAEILGVLRTIISLDVQLLEFFRQLISWVSIGSDVGRYRSRLAVFSITIIAVTSLASKVHWLDMVSGYSLADEELLSLLAHISKLITRFRRFISLYDSRRINLCSLIEYNTVAALPPLWFFIFHLVFN